MFNIIYCFKLIQLLIDKVLVENFEGNIYSICTGRWVTLRFNLVGPICQNDKMVKIGKIKKHSRWLDKFVVFVKWANMENWAHWLAVCFPISILSWLVDAFHGVIWVRPLLAFTWLSYGFNIFTQVMFKCLNVFRCTISWFKFIRPKKVEFVAFSKLRNTCMCFVVEGCWRNFV